MTLKECMFIENRCYIKNQKMTGGKPTGIVVHSTGANNPTLKRYVQPVKSQSYYDEVIKDLGTNLYNNHWNMEPVEKKRAVCVHAFIGKNAAGRVETYQVLPFDVCCWGVGNGSKGSYNYNPVARVQFEICEDNLADSEYFYEAMREAQEFCAYLCKKYNIPVSKISSHKESYYEGYGCDHGDCDYWLMRYGKSMDWFRDEVQKIIAPTASIQSTDVFKKGDLVSVTGSTYYSGATVPSWVKEQKWYVSSVSGQRVVLGQNEAKKTSINSPFKASDLKLAANTPTTNPTVPADKKEVGIGSIVTITGNKYYSGATVPHWVLEKNWVVSSISGERVVLGRSDDGKSSINSPFKKSDLELVESVGAIKDTTIDPDDVVRITGRVYYSGAAVPTWAIEKNWVVKSVSGDRVVLGKSEDGKSSINSPFKITDLALV